MKRVGASTATTGRTSEGAGLARSGDLTAGGGLFAADDLGLSMYVTPPDVEVSVREFEECARDRLRVLHVFDRLCTFETRLDNIKELEPKLKNDLVEARLVLEHPSGLDADTFLNRKADFVRRDCVSHFAMRLAFCKTHDAREWFVRQEQRLFTLRFESLRPDAQEHLVMKSGLKCKRVDMKKGDMETKMKLADIQHTTPAAKIWKEGRAPEWDDKFYLMPFTEIDPRLIAKRQVVLEKGMAYVPSNTLKLILAKRFKDHLAASMEKAFQGLPTALSDPRIGGFLRDLQEYGMHLIVAPKASTEDVGVKLSLENFEEMMMRSFSPCMRRVVEKQRETKKHLKHAGRLQLRPFLKECGFTIEESFAWWKKELCVDPTIDAAAYEKNYTYDTEHAYGKKGHLQGQNSFGCPKLIGFPDEAAGQIHGCPFKNLELPVLKQQMHKWRVGDEYVVEMEKLINNGKHFQLACIEYFKAIHPGHEGDGVGNSPNEFFRESARYYQKKFDKENPKVADQATAVATTEAGRAAPSPAASPTKVE